MIVSDGTAEISRRFVHVRPSTISEEHWGRANLVVHDIVRVSAIRLVLIRGPKISRLKCESIDEEETRGSVTVVTGFRGGDKSTVHQRRAVLIV